MSRPIELAEMADLGIPIDEAAFGVDDLPPDPLADHHDTLLSLYDLERVDGGSMREAISRVVGIRDRISMLQADEHRALDCATNQARGTRMTSPNGIVHTGRPDPTVRFAA